MLKLHENLHSMLVSVTSVVSNSLRSMDYSLLGSFVHGVLQARYWRVLPGPPPGYIPNPGIEPISPVSPNCRQVLYPLSYLGRPCIPYTELK